MIASPSKIMFVWGYRKSLWVAVSLSWLKRRSARLLALAWGRTATPTISKALIAGPQAPSLATLHFSSPAAFVPTVLGLLRRMLREDDFRSRPLCAKTGPLRAFWPSTKVEP